MLKHKIQQIKLHVKIQKIIKIENELGKKGSYSSNIVYIP